MASSPAAEIEEFELGGTQLIGVLVVKNDQTTRLENGKCHQGARLMYTV